jgi:abortive infection bacteriophage resistance protein
MLILFETAAGYALFRADKPKKLEKVENLQKYINDIDSLRNVYLHHYAVFLLKISISSKAQPMRSNAYPS